MTTVGVNVSDRSQAWPGPSTVPAAQPLAAKPDDESETACSVIEAFPSFASVSTCGADVAPGAMLPNSTARGSVQRYPADCPDALPYRQRQPRTSSSVSAARLL